VRFLPKTPSIEDPEARARHPGYDRMPLRAVAEVIRLGREVRAELGRVTAPTRLIFSEREPIVPPGNAGFILEGISSTDRGVSWLTESQHVLPVDLEGRAVSAQILDFMRAQEAA
jgi:esterase/lipase